MVSKILALDRGGFYPSFIAGLESQLDCSVGAPKTLSDARAYLATNLVNLAIVNPYHDQLGPSQAYVDFIKNL